MIKPGRVLFIGDEGLGIIARAAGFESFVFRGDCRELADWLTTNIAMYDVIVYTDNIAEQCSEFRNLLATYTREKLVVELEHPLKREFTDPRKHYKEQARKDLGIEIEL